MVALRLLTRPGPRWVR